jgi:hypothetical protein
MSFARFKKTIRALYEGTTPRGVRFRYALLAFDIVTVAFMVATSFLPRSTWGGIALGIPPVTLPPATGAIRFAIAPYDVASAAKPPPG